MSDAFRISLVVLKMPSGTEMNSGRHMLGYLQSPASQDRLIDACTAATRAAAFFQPNALSKTGDKIFDGEEWTLFRSQCQSDHYPISMGCLGSRVNDSKIL